MGTGIHYQAVQHWAWELRSAKLTERECREHLGKACRKLNDQGVSDRVIAEKVGLSRARIQQLRVAAE